MARVTFEEVTVTYPKAESPSLINFSLNIDDGEFVVLVGPSGCGKSTTLRAVAGLETVTEGRILLDGRDLADVEPSKRDVAMVFQNYALYPHMTVRENLAFNLRLAKIKRPERDRRVSEVAALLELGELLDRKPQQLSGGQRQRVAMGRAIIRRPRVFLMDEPLSNLDARLRVQTRAQITRLTRELGVTTLYVTHDQTEAMTMGDRIAVLDHGQLQQVSAPLEAYQQPSNTFVASFIGSPSINLFDLPEADQQRGNFTGLGLPGGRVTVGVRPDQASLGSATAEPLSSLQIIAIVEQVEILGADAIVYARPFGVKTRDGQLRFRVSANQAPAVSATVHVDLGAAHDLHVFSSDTGRRIADWQREAPSLLRV